MDTKDMKLRSSDFFDYTFTCECGQKLNYKIYRGHAGNYDPPSVYHWYNESCPTCGKVIEDSEVLDRATENLGRLTN